MGTKRLQARHGMIWAIFLPVLSAGLLLLGLVGYQVAQHLAVLTWEPVTATLLDRGVEPMQTDGSSFRARGTARITGRFAYHWQGRRFESTTVALAGTYSRVSGLPDDWEKRLSDHLGEPGGTLQAWVNPRHPDEAVAFGELRWMELGIELGFGLLLTLIGALMVAGWDPNAKTAAFSWRMVGGTWIVGSLLAVLVPLLWRDGHPIGAAFAALPLFLAILGTINGLRRHH